MKLCLIGNFGKSFGQICDEWHIKSTLEKLGHEVHAIQRENFSGMISEHQRLNLDATIFFKWPDWKPDDIVKWKRITQTPVIMWTFDYMERFLDWFVPQASACDIYLGEEITNIWEDNLINFKYFPYHAANSNYFYKINKSKEYDVAFFGTAYGQGGRIELLQAIDKVYDIHAFGNLDWTANGIKGNPPKFDKELSEEIAKARIVIGINWVNTIPGCWSIRGAQTLMTGSFFLTKYVPGMEAEYHDGVEYFNTTEECLDKIGYYLRHEEEREAIADKGYKIAQLNLTTEQRCKDLITIIKHL